MDATDKLIERLTAERDAAVVERDRLKGVVVDALADSESVRTEQAATALEFGARMAEVDTERAKLRAIISECATAIGNGARMGKESKLEFMSFLPKEIEIHFAKLRARVAELERLCDAISRDCNQCALDRNKWRSRVAE